MHTLRGEIGSEFWSVPVREEAHGLFPADTQWFQSGRSALTCILSDIQKKRRVHAVAMPAWCCDSMVKPFADAGVEVRFYPVFPEKGKLVRDLSPAKDCDILFEISYFGYADPAPADFSGIRIRDLTHSIFSGPQPPADYAFGSLRKWAGFHTGGFGWGLSPVSLEEDAAYTQMRSAAMADKLRYLRGETESKAYLGIFGEAEEHLEQCGPGGASARDRELALRLDIPALKQRRRENAARLLDAFGDLAVFFQMEEEDCPLFVPILVPEGKRDALRRHLISRQIYCPVHWPLTDYHRPDGRSMKLYENGLSLICDQRYGLTDMDRLIEAVQQFWKD